MRKKKPQTQSNGHIRIISGKFKGRKLPVKDVEGLRPTTDRVKETLFNWLMSDIRDASILDCFAGSGSLGFECLSRFAKEATFVELDKGAVNQIKANTLTLALDNAFVFHTSALEFLKNNQKGQSFDVVFLDPPFRKDLLSPCCELLEQHHWLHDDTLIYVEFEKESQPKLPDNWQLLKEKQAGQVMCMLFSRT
ncbi:16S rRNA (guanine(966)-N(2))-methyltransferase RsmD [Pseudoalteromonas luteoviolacea]|uniref:Ribosomal RNA small subunit methyltransferase D n=1 Tax=Pseudoalteromonas luteoviolacea TaxID=43657 RepID=A0A1C0TMK4_9GAMM|nr:16S rRNA (guanine(966)-N(2))-methyltransferase RsmD [Pseudoalteromonas luteoviolacea]OCQ20080.1 16S rRNA (guanine(966)-N(2))-methyltransferase RsmD [Pseudoalteromonas luteoviolacea]